MNISEEINTQAQTVISGRMRGGRGGNMNFGNRGGAAGGGRTGTRAGGAGAAGATTRRGQ